MIPGVTTQAPGKRLRVHQIVSVHSGTATTIIRSKAYFKPIFAAIAQVTSIGRSYALPKLLTPHISQAISTARLRTKILALLQSESLRSALGRIKSFTLSQGQSVVSPYNTPASIFGSNLIAWYSADVGAYSDAGVTLATNGQTVQQWNDRSGNSYNLSQATSGNRPTFHSAGFNGKPSVDFVAASATLLATGTSAVSLGGTTAAGFCVCQLTSGTSGNARLLDFMGTGDAADTATAKSGIFTIRTSTTAVTTYRGGVGFGGSGTAISLATNYRLGGVFDGVNQTEYVNNVAGTAFAGAGTWGSTGRIGVGNDPTGGAWNGPVAEIVVVNVAPTSAQRNALDAYFTNKWGI